MLDVGRATVPALPGYKWDHSARYYNLLNIIYKI
jgi:hypothetical protein